MKPRTSQAGSPAPMHKRAGWLSLFAMLMMFIGPLISQSLPTPHAPSMDMSLDPGMSMSMAMPEGNGHDRTLHAVWEKCGYCSLFFHTPALPQALTFIAAARAVASDRLLASTAAGYASPAIFPGARTRAPPA